MPIRYAAYGSNLHPVRLQLRTGKATLLGTTRADGLALRFHKRGSRDGSGKCNIVRAAEDHVHLAVFEVPDSGVEPLDIAEGVGAGYERSWLDLREYGRCLTYRAQESHIDDDLRPFSWYKELVLAGCRAHGFPEEYLQAIQNVNAVPDPDLKRHAMHMRLLERLGGYL